MSKIIPTPAPITTLQFTTIDTNSASNQTILDLAKVPLTTSEIKAMLPVSIIRESQIGDVNKFIVIAHPYAVPKEIDIPTLEAELVYLDNLRKRQVILFTQNAELEAIIKVEENNVLVKMNIILNNARVLGKFDQPLADSAKIITDKYFSHNGTHSKPSTMSLPVNTIVTQSLISGKIFTNKSKAVISILVVGGALKDTILANPFSGVELPLRWINVVITNLSTTEVATYDAFLV